MAKRFLNCHRRYYIDLIGQKFLFAEHLPEKHCLLPLQIDYGILNILFEKITNHFSVHYLLKVVLDASREIYSYCSLGQWIVVSSFLFLQESMEQTSKNEKMSLYLINKFRNYFILLMACIHLQNSSKNVFALLSVPSLSTGTSQAFLYLGTFCKQMIS